MLHVVNIGLLVDIIFGQRVGGLQTTPELRVAGYLLDSGDPNI
jgi:hypothetical protein